MERYLRDIACVALVVTPSDIGGVGEELLAAVVSRLSQILEETPQEKYSLSAKACQGILRRAERRGKDLPKLLKQVLLMQSGSGGAVTEEEKAL